VYFKIFGQNRIKKHEVTLSGKIRGEKTEGKTEKIENRPVPYKGPTLERYLHLPHPLP
jgi:hypothetical protein